MQNISKIAKGDTYALEEVYRENKTYVFRIALSIVNDTYLAEDITQETFIKVQQNAAQYSHTTSEKAWIITIARNLALDMLRKRNHEVMKDDVMQGVTCEESMVEFKSMLKSLSEEDQEIVCLRIISELKFREIASVLGIKAATVRKRYSRCLKQIQNDL